MKKKSEKSPKTPESSPEKPKQDLKKPAASPMGSIITKERKHNGTGLVFGKVLLYHSKSEKRESPE